MSPEQITETKSVTAQSDIYSLGVILWQMVTGQKPYDTNTLSNFQLQTKIVNETLALTRTIWDKNIQKATHKNIDNRYTRSDLFLNDLQYQELLKDDKTIFENKDEVRVALLNEVTTNVTLNAEKIQDSKIVELNDVKVIKVVFKGEWFLVDAYTEVYVNERLILKSSVKKGFNFEIDNVEHLPEIKFKIPLKKKILEIPKLNLNWV
jgi:serine/threonine protein kinase